MAENNKQISGAKFLLSLFILYSGFIKEAYGNYHIILYGTVILATILIAVDIMNQRWKLPVFGFQIMLVLFGLYSFATGIIVSRDLSLFYSMMVTFFAFSIVCYDCCYIIKRTGSSEWILNIFLVTAIACSIKTIFFGADYRTEVIVRTMSERNNPNFLGLVMIVGIFALISRKRYITRRFWITVAIALAFLYVIVLTGSRKCLISALFLVAMWIVSVLRTERSFSTKKTSMIIAVLVAIGIGINYFITKYSATSSFARMLLLSRSAVSRASLYQDAIEYWKTSPIIGIGFCQYQVWSPYKLYSHSSYAEVLCCTGIIGCLLFFVPIAYYLFRIIRAAMSRDRDNHYDFMMSMFMMVIELVLGLGQIFIYDVIHLLMLTYLFMGTEYIAKENKEYSDNIDQYGETILGRRFFPRMGKRKLMKGQRKL